MNKSETKEAARAVAIAESMPAVAASMLATLHRSTLGGKKTRHELELLLERHSLFHHLERGSLG